MPGLMQILQGADAGDKPDGCELLLGFNFGQGANPVPGALIAAIDLRPIDQPTLFEGWWYRGAVNRLQRGNVQLAECDHFTAALIQKPETDPSAIRELTRDAYRELYASLDIAKHDRIVRIWNYFGQINRGSEDRERYRQFSIGRAEAFEEIGITDEFLPPGTAIGTVADSTLSIIALASNNGFLPCENPRQLSAYCYPAEHGPRSPKFSRGGMVSFADSQLFLMSGTASIVGHRSAHPLDTAAQTLETLRNIKSLLAQTDDEGSEWSSKVIRVYLRNPEDRAQTAPIVERWLADSGFQLAYLQGDICRTELLVEIDGVFGRSSVGADLSAIPIRG